MDIIEILDILFQILIAPMIILSIVGIVYGVFILFVQAPFLYLKENYFNKKKPKNTDHEQRTKNEKPRRPNVDKNRIERNG